MWISKNKYNEMVEEIASLKRREKDKALRISDLLLKIDELNLKLYDNNKNKCYDIDVVLQNGRILRYVVCAETAEEAREIAANQFEKDNLNFSKKDIRIIFSRKI